MMDYLFDGFIIDYMVQQEIRDSLSNMRRLEKEIERVCEAIQQRKEENKERRSQLQQEWQAKMEQL